MSSNGETARTAPPPVQRVIVLLDVVGSVRLMERDERGFIERWQQFVREARTQVVEACGGRIHKSTGDGLMLEFAEACNAVRAAFELLRVNDAQNQDHPAEDRIRLRVAAHLAQFVADEYDIYGCGVNLTSRLLDIAGPGEICITAAVRELLAEDLAGRLEDAGFHQLRHVREPVQVFRVRGVPSPEQLPAGYRCWFDAGPFTSAPAACASE